METQAVRTDNTKKPRKPLSPKKELLLFLSIPTAVILLVAGLVWVPRLMAHPKYDFIYSYCPEYYCDFEYKLENGTITKSYGNSYSARIVYGDKIPELNLYNAKTESVRSISLENANSYQLDTSTTSPDGYTLTQNNASSGGFLFWSGSYDDSWKLKNGMKQKNIPIKDGTGYSYGTVKFLGWVEQ